MDLLNDSRKILYSISKCGLYYMENYISNIFTLANFEWSPVNKFIIYNLIIGFNSMDYPPLPSPLPRAGAEPSLPPSRSFERRGCSTDLKGQMPANAQQI